MTTQNNKGVTLVELLIVITLLAVLYIGLSRLIKNISTAYWKNTSQLVLQEESRNAMHYITQELQGARASSIGMVGPFDSTAGGGIDGGINSGFEFPSGSGNPFGWDVLVSSQVAKISSSGSPRSGLYSICLNPTSSPDGSTIIYNSSNITVFQNGLYWVSFWARTTNGANNGQVTINGVSRIVNPAAAQNWQWVHDSFPVNLTVAGNPYQLTLQKLANGTSVYFDDISVSTGTVVMNALTGATTAVFQKIVQNAGGTQNRVRRIRYAPATGTTGIEKRGKLYLEQWIGLGDIFNNNNWELIEPNPLCQYVSTFTITNINQQGRFDISLDLENDEPRVTTSAGLRRYNSRAKVSPYLP